jgi:hypothetical protein
MRGISYFIFLFNTSNSIFYPNSLNGKRILLNGPAETLGKSTSFDGDGIITSVVFKNNNITFSELSIEKSSFSFPLRYFKERNYVKMFSKIFSAYLWGKKSIESGTCNTIVLKYNDFYYATEETCRPAKLYYDEDNHIRFAHKSWSIPRMGAHMIDNRTIFSYDIPNKYPLKINNTHRIPWSTNKYPAMIHDAVKTDDGKYYIFPLTSTGLGDFEKYMEEIVDLPLDPKLNKAGFIIYDIESNKCSVISLDEYVDLFHIAHIERVSNGVYKLYLPFIYDFFEYLSLKSEDVELIMKEVTLNITNNSIVEIYNTNLRMDFINEYEGYLISSSLSDKPKVIFYDIKNRVNRSLPIPGEIVREIIPYKGMLIYFSHEKNLTETVLYVITMNDGDILTKVQIPNRPPGMHTTMY